jgi:DNA polymerase-3 subunit gamma/tau
MLSQSAFNAFLKTLEEPPAHAIFVLATTEKHKIIPTILSRCQIFDFNRIRVEDGVDYLKQIAEKESLEYEEDALHVIAQKADGAMRDALSIFDQVVSFSDGKITYQDVIRNLNILDYEYYFRLTRHFLENDVSSSLLLLNEVLARGFDARNFINGFAAHLRDLMVCKNPETVQLMEVGAGIKDKYLEQSKEVPLNFLFGGLEICNEADIQFRISRNQRLTIELALVKLANFTEVQKKKSVTEDASKAPNKNSSGATAATPASSPASTPIPRSEADHSTPKVSPTQTETDHVSPVGNGNGASRIVRRSTISIKDTLHGNLPVTEKKEKTDVTKSEDSSREKTELKPVDPDQILQAWKGYAESIQKNKPRTYSTLINNRPEIKADGTVVVSLNSEAQRDNFVKNVKPHLSSYIRDTAGLEKVEIVAQVTETEQNGKKIYTDQDKLDFLMKKNPELGYLKSRFNLDFDD